MTGSNISSVKRVLHEIATHAYNLGMGLQNAAPPEAKVGSSIQYLKDVSVQLNDTCNKIDELISNNPK